MNTNDWQPIDTAPTKTEVLVYVPARNGRDSQTVVASSGESGKYWHSIPGAWGLTPTHWMPLPEPPPEEPK